MKLFKILTFAFLLVLVSCSKDDEDTLQVFSKDATISGFTMPKLSEEFAKWVFTKPINKNPLSDADGSFHKDQPLNDFVFLSPNLGEVTTRNLTFSHNKNVYIPVMGVTGWYYDNDPCDPDFKPAAGQTPKAFLQEFLKGALETSSNLVLTLNGTNIVDDLTKYKVTSDHFTSAVHNDWNNPSCDYNGKKANLYSEDYAVCIKLPKGNHVLKVKGEYKDDNFVQDITWNLTVN